MGQNAVTTVLQNSLRSGRIAHAYLFYGARGCGKTSTARLLSRALNCEAQDAPTAEPCGKCKICVAIRDGSCMDVVEIDAASETGVDNVREKIIENVQYVPTEARYKIYIIDEVHDLSAKAFDALLKTLEEPPPHVVFILATTEQHKVPITIRSRCIPFQFKRGSMADLCASIERVVTAEGYAAEPAAIRAIARAAEGSWRDALSLLEQVLAFSHDALTEEIVQQALGTVGSETLGRVADTVAKNDWACTLQIAGELIESGKDARQLIGALNGYYRDLLLIASGALSAAAAELGADRLEQLSPRAALYTSDQLLRILGMLAAAEKETRTSNQHRWLLERVLCSIMPANLVRNAESGSEHVARDAAAERHYRPSKIAAPASPMSPGADAATEPQDSSADVAVQADGPSRFVGETTAAEIRRSWLRIVKAVEKASPLGGSFLSKSTVEGLDGKVIELSFTDALALDRIMNQGRSLVEKKINEYLKSDGYKIRLAAVAVNDSGPAAEGARHADPPPAGNGNGALDLGPPQTQPASTATDQGATFLEEALEIFGGEVIRTEEHKRGPKQGRR